MSAPFVRRKKNFRSPPAPFHTRLPCGILQTLSCPSRNAAVGVSCASCWRAIAVALALASSGCHSGPASEETPSAALGAAPAPPALADTAALAPTSVNERGETIVHPRGLGMLRTSVRDIHGDRAGVACSTCHVDLPARMVDTVDELEDFHTEMEMAHGELSCGTCHDREDRDKLRLIDGEAIAYLDVMNLCAQCHSREYRAYRHGAHGGMTGYWDRERGERTRLSCIGCHDPHAPAFPQMMPAPPPRDRFFEPKPPQSAPPEER